VCVGCTPLRRLLPDHGGEREIMLGRELPAHGRRERKSCWEESSLPMVGGEGIMLRRELPAHGGKEIMLGRELPAHGGYVGGGMLPYVPLG